MDEGHTDKLSQPQNLSMETQSPRNMLKNSIDIHTQSECDEDDDEDAVLDVLPAKRRTPLSCPSSTKQRGPRLSFSGQAAHDAVDLLDDEEESPIRNNLRARLVARMNDYNNSDTLEDDPVTPAKASIQTSIATHNPSPDFDTSLHSRLDAKASRAASMSVLESTLTTALAQNPILDRKPSPVRHPSPEYLDSSESDNDQSDNGGLSNQQRTASRKGSTSLLSSSESSSDDDSFTAKCRAFDKNRVKSKSNIQENQSTRRTVTKPSRENGKAKPQNPAKASDEDKNARKKKAKEQRELARKQLKEQKEMEKRKAKEQRERERLAKEQAKKEAKRQRREQRDKSNQVHGRFANQEIVVLAEPTLLDTSANPWNIQRTLSDFGFHHVRAYQSGLSCNAIQFIRQDYLHGGAEKAIEDLIQEGSSHTCETSYEHIPILGVIVEAEIFVNLMQGEEDGLISGGGNIGDDDYPELEQWLFGLIEGWRAAWRKTSADWPRVILLLYKINDSLDRLWVQYNSTGRRGRIPPTTEQFHDAVLWMLIQFQIESIHCDTAEDVTHEIYKMTRFLSDAPYVRQATELQALAKLPAHVSDMAPSFDRARDTWIRQLQQIPRISADMAHNVSIHYPTALSLWNTYQDDTISTTEKQTLLSDLFGTKASQTKLSYHVYQALTSDNPQDILR
jgi:hypothetical protein